MDDDFSFGGGLSFNSGRQRDETGSGGLYPERDQTGTGGLYPDFERETQASRTRQQEIPIENAPAARQQAGIGDAIGGVIGGVLGGIPGLGSMLKGGQDGGGGLFGSGVILPGILGRPQYKVDSNATPQQQAASLIEQQAQRAGQVASNPLVQLFNPDAAAKARQQVLEAPGKLAEIKGLEQKQTDMQQAARNYGVSESKINPFITNDTIDNDLLQRYRNGDITAAKALQARGKAEWVNSFAAEAADAYQNSASTASLAIGKLSNATNSPVAYQEALKALPAEEREALTQFLNQANAGPIPQKPEQFKALQAKHGAAFMQMQQMLATMRQKTRTMQDFSVTQSKDVSEQYTSNFKIGGTAENAGLPIYGRALDGQLGGIAPAGSVREEMFGRDGGWNISNPERLKTVRETVEGAVPKTELEKFRHANRLYGMATTDAQGNTLAAGKINTNPNVQQGIAEGLASELRGGLGGANVGLLKIEGDKRGWTQAMLDKMKAGWAGVVNVTTGPDGKRKEYLTDETQRQMREVLDYLHSYNNTNMKERLGGAALQAGRYGISMRDAGLADLGTALTSDYEEGRLATVNGFRALPRIVRGNQAIYFPQGSNPEGANAARDPMTLPDIGGGPAPVQNNPNAPAPGAVQTQGSYNPPGGYGDASAPIPGERNIPPLSPQAAPTPAEQARQQGWTGVAPASAYGGPGQPPLPASFQRAQQTPAPACKPCQAPLATGPQLVNIAGQNLNVNVPAGASTSYVARMQNIETPGIANPWTATTKNSSASGAFQFINGTWAANKPPGAPARAKDATPQQQVQALEKFTARNAQVLGARGLPVNDTTLYMAHNLGAEGAAKLLKADPNASASAVVGADAANNNPKFFKGGATVAQAIERYGAAMGGPVASGGGVRAVNARGMPATAQSVAGVGMTPEQQNAASQQRFEQAAKNRYAAQRERMGQAMEGTGGRAAEMIPAATSTVGAIGGGLVGGAVGGPAGAVAGGIAGGSIGGGAGQMLKDWTQGNEQSPGKIAKEAALGGVLGVVPAARPVAGAVARVVGVGTVEGGEAYLQGKSAADIAEAAVKGGATGLAGEAVGRALGMAGHKIFSRYTEETQQELVNAGVKIAEGRKALETMNPKLATGGPNPAYQKLTDDVKASELKIKDAGFDVDNFVYAAEQVKSGTSKGEAKIMQAAQEEQRALGKQYDELHQRAGQTPGRVKANIPVEDGPLSKIRSADNPAGKVGQEYAQQAEHAEMLIRAPAPNWEAKSRQLQQAGSELLAQERVFRANNDEVGVKAMRELFDGVRQQQIRMADALMKPGEASKFISDLKRTDKAYARLMDATHGMNVQDMQRVLAQGNTPAARKIEAAFREMAANDPEVMRVFNAMKASARGDNAAAGAKLGPLLSKVRGAAKYSPFGLERIAQGLDAWAHWKMLGQHVKIGDLLAKTAESGVQNQLGAAGARATAM